MFRVNEVDFIISQKDSIQGSLQFKDSVLTIILWSQVQ